MIFWWYCTCYVYICPCKYPCFNVTLFMYRCYAVSHPWVFLLFSFHINRCLKISSSCLFWRFRFISAYSFSGRVWPVTNNKWQCDGNSAAWRSLHDRLLFRELYLYFCCVLHYDIRSHCTVIAHNKRNKIWTMYSICTFNTHLIKIKKHCTWKRLCIQIICSLLR